MSMKVTEIKGAIKYAYSYVIPLYRIFYSFEANEIFYKKKVKERLNEYERNM